ncbi:efflux RND transporter permease subunit [Alkalicoccobacillus porphyridii]|uniref:Efflux RND transporter permease subunit n=1 Tax=Alkalicoccobacillus porphyridii TaxID=2597270 RepID=A0A553ZUI6_9BACI|nr:efflux RND transporter permease subunit [Alkalicoccobacillus porphyridii]TSB45160.1 efflux RND transporter permease subunit [Alkalicoccobacillus porphyridii]
MINFSIRRPIFTIVGMVLFIIIGVVSITRLPLQLFPEINPPVGAVITSYSDVNPGEIEDTVTIPLERQLATTSGLNNMTSNSTEGTSMIILEFDWTTNIDDVELDIINTIRSANLPDDANEPTFVKFDPSMMPMIQMAVTSNADLIDFQDDVRDLEDEILKVPGVASVGESGSLSEEILVSLNPDELEDANLSQSDIVSAIQANDISLPGGTVIRDDLSLTTRVISELNNVEDLENLVVGLSDTGDDIALSDVASVNVQTEDQEVISRANQQEAIQLSIMPESGANTVQISNAVNDRLDELLQEEEYEELEASILYDEGDFIIASINSVTSAMVIGGLLAMAVLLFFLRNLKTPFIVGIAIPFSVIVTFGFMFFADIGLNIMSLGGLALGIGMLVDNAIVVIENIYRHLSMKKEPKQAAFDGTKEVSGAIIASTLTTISVFLPIVFISGIIGDLFRELAYTVSFSLLASLLVALTVVPMLASRLLRTPKESTEEKRRSSSTMKWLRGSTIWVLKHRFIVLLTTFVLLVVGILGLTTVGTELIPDSDQGSFTIDIEMEPGTSLDRTQEAVQSVEDVLEDYQEIEDYVSTAGSGDNQMMGGSDSSYTAEITVSMLPHEDRTISTADFVESIERDLERADDDAEVRAYTASAALGGEANTLQFTITDSNQERLYEQADELEQELNDEQSIRDVELSIEEQVPEIVIDIDKDAARENLLTPAEIAQQVNAATRGETATVIEEDNEFLDVIVQLESEATETVSDIEQLSLLNTEGEYVELNEVAEVEEGESPASIQRLNQEGAVEFTVTYAAANTLSGITATVDDIVADLELDESTTFTYGGEREILDDSINNMILAIVLAAIFIYLIMAAQFESLKLPFIIMFTVPLVVIGLAIALVVTQTAIGITAFIGLIILLGIVVNNGIVMLDFVNQLKARGLSTHDALVESVQLRTRPIIMTSATTILGMIPLALAFGEGAEFQQPMAIAIIGGLISGTILTLFVIPVVYSLLDSETRKKKKYITIEGEFYEVTDTAGISERKNKQKEEQLKLENQADSSEDEHEIRDTNQRTNASQEEILDALEQLLKNRKRNNDKDDS